MADKRLHMNGAEERLHRLQGLLEQLKRDAVQSRLGTSKLFQTFERELERAIEEVRDTRALTTGHNWDILAMSELPALLDRLLGNLSPEMLAGMLAECKQETQALLKNALSEEQK